MPLFSQTGAAVPRKRTRTQGTAQFLTASYSDARTLTKSRTMPLLMR